MKPKTLFVLSGIIGGIFILIMIVLAVSDKIKLGPMIIFVVIVIVIIAAVDGIFYFKNKQNPDGDPIAAQKDAISREQAKALSDELLGSPDIAEIPSVEEGNVYEDVLEFGSKNTPIFIRIVRGEFEKKMYGIVINMLEPQRRGIEEYDDTKMTYEDIKAEVFKRANAAAFSPRPEIPYRKTKNYDPLTGRTIEQEEPVFDYTQLQKKEEGLA